MKALELKLNDIAYTAEVYKCSPEDTVEKVVSEMQNLKIGSAVIVDGSKPIGMFTERDFFMKIGILQKDTLAQPISNFMSPNPKTCLSNTSIIEVLETMNNGKFRHLIVTNEAEELMGVISIKDLFGSLIKMIKNTDSNYDDLKTFFSSIEKHVYF